MIIHLWLVLLVASGCYGFIIQCGQFGDVVGNKPCSRPENCNLPFGISVFGTDLLPSCQQLEAGNYTVLSVDTQHHYDLNFSLINSTTCRICCNYFTNNYFGCMLVGTTTSHVLLPVNARPYQWDYQGQTCTAGSLFRYDRGAAPRALEVIPGGLVVLLAMAWALQ